MPALLKRNHKLAKKREEKTLAVQASQVIIKRNEPKMIGKHRLAIQHPGRVRATTIWNLWKFRRMFPKSWQQLKQVYNSTDISQWNSDFDRGSHSGPRCWTSIIVSIKFYYNKFASARWKVTCVFFKKKRPPMWQACNRKESNPLTSFLTQFFTQTNCCTWLTKTERKKKSRQTIKKTLTKTNNPKEKLERTLRQFIMQTLCELKKKWTTEVNQTVKCLLKHNKNSREMEKLVPIIINKETNAKINQVPTCRSHHRLQDRRLDQTHASVNSGHGLQSPNTCNQTSKVQTMVKVLVILRITLSITSTRQKLQKPHNRPLTPTLTL